MAEYLNESLLLSLVADRPKGLSAGEIHDHFNEVSRPTINRFINQMLDKKLLITKGKGPSVVYLSADPFLSIKKYFEAPSIDRPVARFNQDFLNNYHSNHLLSLTESALKEVEPAPLEKRDFVQFLIDFSCASSVLEGGAYSQLDTQALIEYNEMANDKSIEDAYLVLNHKHALEYLYEHLLLDVDSAIKINTLLTDNHGYDVLKKSIHFSEKEKVGIREYDEVNINTTSYLPPFRPGTGYINKMFNHIIQTANTIKNPLTSAFYLFSRIPYLQPFSDGNKRTSRVLCNVPLMKAGLPPISFIDFNKRDYIVSMLSIYELNDTRYAEKTFGEAYLKSINRLSLGKKINQYLRPK